MLNVGHISTVERSADDTKITKKKVENTDAHKRSVWTIVDFF